MAKFLAQSTIVPALVTSRSHGPSKESAKSKRSVKMMSSLQAPGLRITTFSGLRASDSLGNMVRFCQDFRSNIAISVPSRRGRGSRCVPKAMFERFNEKSIKVITLAQEEARRLGHNFVDTEQILLGLIDEGNGIAAKALKSMGINLKDARVEVEKIIGMGSGFVVAEIPFTPRTIRVLELSLQEARQLGHDFVGTEHLLLGLLREGEGVATRVLENLGSDPSNIRKQVLRMLSEGNEVSIVSTGKTKMPTLEEYGTNLTKLAEEGKLDPVVGRQDQIECVVQILGRLTNNNPCLIGEPGVGKTAIAEGLAQRIASGDVLHTVERNKVIALDMGRLVAGTKYRGEFEERLKKIMEEIKQSDDEIILFIDDLHTLIGAGAAEGAIDAANILKPALARGELRCIGATTLDEYRKHIEKDPALERRFQPVIVPEPSVDETIQILKGLIERYETHHKVRYTDDALISAAQLSYQYINDRFLPDKAIDLIDEAGSRVRLRHAQLPEEARELEKELKHITMSKNEAVRRQDFYKAGELRYREIELMGQIIAIQEKNKAEAVVTEVDIQHIIPSWTGIPVGKVSTDETVKAISRAIRRARAVEDFSVSSRRGRGSRYIPKAMSDERFTAKAIKAIMLAQEEAVRLGQNFVGTEQILLGLIGEGTGIAARVLKSMGINLEDARVEVEKIIGSVNGFVAVEIPFTPRAKRVLELSLEEARQLGHDFIGAEHLLLGLVREDEGVAARVLETLGADPSNIRTQVIQLLWMLTVMEEGL